MESVATYSFSDIDIKIHTSHGLTIKSKLLLNIEQGLPTAVVWRGQDKIGCEINQIIKVETKDDYIVLKFIDQELKLSFDDTSQLHEVYDCLWKGIRQRKPNETPMSKEFAFAHLDYKIAMKQEQALQTTASINCRACIHKMQKFKLDKLSDAWSRWIRFAASESQADMIADKQRWRLHAVCNQEQDLQAWYHAVFYEEVYRLRGPFWFHDALLPTYRKNYDLVDNKLTPLEEAALAHVLCSPNTTYGDVAGQMFIVQAVAQATAKTKLYDHVLTVNKLIECNASGRGTWYSGCITNVNKNDTFDITYDDSTVAPNGLETGVTTDCIRIRQLPPAIVNANNFLPITNQFDPIKLDNKTPMSTLPPEVVLFQNLTTNGVSILKYPRTGRPSKKMFRISFVEGNIYLTWLGNFGNQGIDLGDVDQDGVMIGITTPVLKRFEDSILIAMSAQLQVMTSAISSSKSKSSSGSGKAVTASPIPIKVNRHKFLSLKCKGRSVDLGFDTEEQGAVWESLMKILVAKEHGELLHIESPRPEAAAEDFEWFAWYMAIGERAVTAQKLASLRNTPLDNLSSME